MSNEYPKALYKGNQSEPEMVTVDGLEQEQDKRNAGYVDYAELPKYEPRASSNVGSGTGINANNEEVDSLKAELLQALKDKEEIENNFVGFRNDIQAMKARITEIQGDVYLGQSSEIGAEPTPNYENLTSAELKALLKERNVTFKVNATKPELIALLGG